MIKRILIAIIYLTSFNASATHIVGGYFSYKCNGVTSSALVEYEVTLRIYQDCNPGNFGGDPSARIALYNTSNVLLRIDSLSRTFRDTLPDDIGNPCVVSSPAVCVEEVIYKSVIQIPRAQDVILVYQRCCRNSTIDNLVDPDDQGVTHTALIPAFNRLGCNNSPEFNSFPPIVLCSGFDINLDLSATDSDGDSLVYSICSPFNYSNQFAPLPTIPNPPPYLTLPYQSPQTATDPIPSNPAISINSRNGKVSGVATSLGQYVAGFCVEEYRNGALINSVRRGIQINTGNCSPVITSAVQDQELFCDGLTVKFNNQSTANVNIQSYKWDFGDPTTLADTSRAFDTVYTYPDTGLYTITLISNPDLPCNDTSTKQFKVYKKLSPIIEFDGKTCVNNNLVNFVAKGEYEPYATFNWTFGNANVSTSNLDSVPNVSFLGSGTFPVSLIVEQDDCSDTLNRSVTLVDNPIADFDYGPIAGCYPLDVDFNNLSQYTGTVDFLWDFGDGSTSTEENPTHTYTANGLYDVELELRTTSECIDTVFKLEVGAIDISLDSSKNEIQFSASPLQACPGTPINFFDSSTYEGNADYYWDFGNNQLSTEQNPVFVYNDTGKYSVGLILITKDKCIDTLVKTFPDYIEILPEPISDMVISDSTKPLKQANFTIDVSASEFAAKSSVYINNSFVSNASVFDYTFSDTGHFQVLHVAENNFGCTDSTTLEVFIYDEFEFIIPNIFTPNGDRVNDEFAVRACGVYDYEIEIFNRYGKTMFQSNSMNINWNGRTNEEPATDGIYYYVITIKDFRGEYRTYTGPLTLIRD